LIQKKNILAYEVKMDKENVPEKSHLFYIVNGFLSVGNPRLQSIIGNRPESGTRSLAAL